MLAEAGAGFDHIGVIDGGEEGTAASGNWRARSPTGLLPLMSGLGIPRSQVPTLSSEFLIPPAHSCSHATHAPSARPPTAWCCSYCSNPNSIIWGFVDALLPAAHFAV